MTNAILRSLANRSCFIRFIGLVLFHKTLETSEPEINKAAPSANIDKNLLMNASFTNINGQQQFLKQWQGNIIVLNFWATWCPPCREEMPEALRDARSI